MDIIDEIAIAILKIKFKIENKLILFSTKYIEFQVLTKYANYF